MQIGPEHHQHGKHEPSRSSQAFAIEDDAEQHRACIRRDREIHVRRSFVSGIEQAGQEDRDADRDRRRAVAERDRGQDADDRCAAGHRQQDEAAKACVLKRRTGKRVPEPGQIEPWLVAVGERPGVVERDGVALPDDISGRQMPAQIVMAEQKRRVQDVEQADERDQEQINSRSQEKRADRVRSLVECRLVPDLMLIHRFPHDKASPMAPRSPTAGCEPAR